MASGVKNGECNIPIVDLPFSFPHSIQGQGTSKGHGFTLSTCSLQYYARVPCESPTKYGHLGWSNHLEGTDNIISCSHNNIS